jgi:hypothetical protein
VSHRAGPLRFSPRFALVCAVTAVLAAVYGIALPNLLDRDEASFYATVQWYATHGSIPVLGHVGVSYEAQQGPGYYVPAAVLQWASQPLGTETAFHVVRAMGRCCSRRSSFSVTGWRNGCAPKVERYRFSRRPSWGSTRIC